MLGVVKNDYDIGHNRQSHQYKLKLIKINNYLESVEIRIKL